MRWLDTLYVRLAPRARVFELGWGELPLVAGLDPSLRAREPDPAAIRWTRARVHGRLAIREGELESPDDSLPVETRLARVLLLSPREGGARGLVVGLAAWGDETFAARRRLLARALDGGLAVLLLENPFYGRRRRVGQTGPRLLYASDFFAMGRATVLEARALLAWARTHYERVGVAGFSMGAQLAGMTAALVPWPVRAVLVASALSPARVFFDGPLRADVARAPLGEGGLERLRDAMERLSLLELPPPHAPALARLVGTRGDAIVPPADTGAIARHWGAPVRWIDDGHVSAVLLRPHAMGQAVLDAFA